MMGCFLKCFTSSKHRRSQKPVRGEVPSGDQRLEAHEARQHTKPRERESIDNSFNLTMDPDIKNTTFDLNVESHEEMSSQEVANSSLVENGKESEKEKREGAQSESPTLPAFSLHRYQNFSNDYDCEEIDLEDSNTDGDGADKNDKVLVVREEYLDSADGADGNDEALVGEESSESLFSISIESGKPASTAENDYKEVNSPIAIYGWPLSLEFKRPESRGVKSIDRRRNENGKHVFSALNPVGNLHGRRWVKHRGTLSFEKHQAKENMDVNVDVNAWQAMTSEEPSFKHSYKKEMGVETSFSCWLVEFGTKPEAQDSPNSIGSSSRNLEERPMSMEHKQVSHESSSPSRSAEETPIFGSVGSYWSRTGQRVHLIF